MGNLYHKSKISVVRMSAGKSQEILEREMAGVGNGVPKEETYYNRGDAERKAEIDHLENHEDVGGVCIAEIPECEVVID